jgi:mRNA degradation ribonuclease J1/J2
VAEIEVIICKHLRWGQTLALRSLGVRGLPGPKIRTWGTHSFWGGQTCATRQKADYGMVKEKVRAELKRLIQKTTGRRPMIMPVILEI